MTTLIKGGDHRYLKKRGLSEETCIKFDYRVAENAKGKTVQVANYKNAKGKTVAQKVRDAKKNFMITGGSKKLPLMLFGQSLWRDSGPRIVITEGEIDAMSVSQAQGNKWPVVSLPCGAQNGAKAIAHHLEWLERFDAVVLAFDSDDPGIQAAQECAAMLSPGKAFIARLPMKDANEMLVARKGKELIDALWSAKAWRPDGIVDIASIVDDAVADIEVGKDWPWATLSAATYGRRRGELYGFGGGTGCGKSTLFKQIARHVIEVDKLSVGVLFLEEPPELTAKTHGRHDDV